MPSNVTGAPFPGQANHRAGLRASRRAIHQPQARAAAADGQAAKRGNSDAITEPAASKPSASKAATSQRDGRHSSRQAADPADERVECGIGGGLEVEEPAPEPIVFAVQHL